MSVTFVLKDTPYVRVNPEAENWDLVPAEGFYELNVANATFVDLMMQLGRVKDAKRYYGEWLREELLPILLSVRKAKNIEGVLVTDDVVDGNIVHCGRSQKNVNFVLSQLEKILTSAIEKSTSVVFA